MCTKDPLCGQFLCDKFSFWCAKQHRYQSLYTFSLCVYKTQRLHLQKCNWFCFHSCHPSCLNTLKIIHTPTHVRSHQIVCVRVFVMKPKEEKRNNVQNLSKKWTLFCNVLFEISCKYQLQITDTRDESWHIAFRAQLEKMHVYIFIQYKFQVAKLKDFNL